jgi:hypothetical protein
VVKIFPFTSLVFLHRGFLSLALVLLCGQKEATRKSQKGPRRSYASASDHSAALDATATAAAAAAIRWRIISVIPIFPARLRSVQLHLDLLESD